MDETYVKVKGAWKYLYRAIDKADSTVDFLLTAKRDGKAALRFLRKAIKITIDKSGANKAAIESFNSEHKTEHDAGIELQATDVTNAGVQILLVSRRNARWDRVDAHDPDGPVAPDRRALSRAAVLFTRGMSKSGFLDSSRPPRKFATEP